MGGEDRDDDADDEEEKIGSKTNIPAREVSILSAGARIFC